MESKTHYDALKEDRDNLYWKLDGARQDLSLALSTISGLRTDLEAANPKSDWEWEYFTPSDSNPLREGDEILKCRRPRDLLSFTQEEKDAFIERIDHE